MNFFAAVSAVFFVCHISGRIHCESELVHLLSADAAVPFSSRTVCLALCAILGHEAILCRI